MNTSPRLPIRTHIVSALVALSLLGGALGVAKSAAAAAPAMPDRGALVSVEHRQHVAVATIRGDLARTCLDDEVRNPLDGYRPARRIA